jgi:hypothetical protein
MLSYIRRDKRVGRSTCKSCGFDDVVKCSALAFFLPLEHLLLVFLSGAKSWSCTEKQSDICVLLVITTSSSLL